MQIKFIKILYSTTTASIITMIQDLPDENIVIGLAKKYSVSSQSLPYDYKYHIELLDEIASGYNALSTSYGVKQKIFLAFDRINAINPLTTENLVSKMGAYIYDSVNNYDTPEVVGIEMTIAAYLSQIDVYKQG